MKTIIKLKKMDSSTLKLRLMQSSIGLIYLWFGGLKFFESLSPAEALASKTIQMLTFELIPEHINFLLLAGGETVLGLLLIIGVFPRVVIKMAIAHMICTFLPMVLLPAEVFNQAPFTLTLTGQYIMKNLVVLSALIILHPSKRQKMQISINNLDEGNFRHAI